MEKEMIILFDLDGTLIDSTEAILESCAMAYAVLGGEAPPEWKIKAEIGHPLDHMFATFGIAEEVVWEYVAAYKNHYRMISCEKTHLLPGAREAVMQAYSHAVLGVVTTKTAKYSVELLEHMGLMDYFDVLIGREDVRFPKPHPEPIEKALAKLPTVTDRIWMVGDTCMDMQCAREAKVGAVGVACGYGSQEKLAACSDKVCQSAREAVAFIVHAEPY